MTGRASVFYRCMTMMREEWGAPKRIAPALASSLGKYDLVASVGRGGMADVFLAVARGPMRFDKVVVIKRLRDALAEDASFRTMFVDEARLAARVNHPNVVHTYEVGEHEGAYFIAMEYLDGQPLSAIQRAIAKEGSSLEAGLAVRIAADALCGLHHAHELCDYDDTPLGIVHRDVSPENLFVTYDGQVKVVDFGIAKATLTSTSTESGVLKGKAGYMAPEQALGVACDRRADLFSIGVVLWEMLAGRRLFAAEGLTATVQRVLNDAAPSLCTLGVDPALDAIVARALEKNPQSRFASADEMRLALEAYLLTRNDGLRASLGARVSSLFTEERDAMHRQVQAFMATGMSERPEPVHATSANVITTARGVASSGNGAALYDDLPDTVPHGTARVRRRRRNIGVLTGALVAGALLVVVTAITIRRLQPARPLPVVSAAAAAPLTPLLRLSGSNTMGAELVPALAEGFLRHRGGENVDRHSDTSAHELVVASKDRDGALHDAITIRAEGTSTGFTGLAAGECDVGMASRRIKAEEIAALQARGLGDMSSPASEHVVGLDGIAVVVNANNPLRSVDMQQLRGIFDGEIVAWRAVGSDAPGAIVVYARDDHSGTYDTFRQLVLGERPLVGTARRFAASDALSDSVASDVLGIGFIGLVYVRNAKPLGIRDHDAAPLYPSTFTVATEDYPLSRRLFLYTPVAAPPVVQEFVSFALSAEGQRIVKEAGFVDLRVFARDLEPCAGTCAPPYAALTRRARRLSLDFRFDAGSAKLDSRAIRDIDRLLAFLRPMQSPRLVLVGFSERGGDGDASVRLSRERADGVRAELVARGIHVTSTLALGNEMPLVADTTDLERERNRRVEVWLE